MIGTTPTYDAPTLTAKGTGEVVLLGGFEERLGGSELLAQLGGADRFPDLPADPKARIEAITAVAGLESTGAVHDVSDGGLLVTLAEMVHEDGGLDVTVPTAYSLFSEAPGRVVVETTDRDALETAVGDSLEVVELGEALTEGELSVTVEEADKTVSYDFETLVEFRSTLEALG